MIKVGREAGLDVVIDNVAVSRHQMEIRLQDMKWVGPAQVRGRDLLRQVLALLRPRDTLVLCTDGLTRQVRPHEIRRLAGSRSPRRACERLVALANERGGPDNITLQLIRFGPQSLLPAALSSLRVW